jgi:sec-independent protein translocase protein TatC
MAGKPPRALNGRGAPVPPQYRPCGPRGNLLLGHGLSEQPPLDEYDEAGLGENAPAVAAGKPMGFLDHLEDLRWTLIKCALVFAVSVGFISFYLKEFYGLLLLPLENVRAEFPQFTTHLVTNSPMGIFSMLISIALVGGVGLSLPFWFFFVAQFIAPALTKKEIKVLAPACLAALVLFLIGAAFGYFLLVPSTVRVSYELHAYTGVDPMWTADKYFGLLTWLVLGVGVTFEFPLLIVLATYIGLVEVATLRKYRRHAVVVCFIISAIVTPTPDMVTQTLFAGPLCLLYELSIWASVIIGRRKHAV